MRLFALVLLIFTSFIALNCASSREEKKIQSWLSMEYINCMKNGLPCECEKSNGKYYSVVLDSNVDGKGLSVALSTFEEMEAKLYPIRKVKNNEFAVLLSRRDTVAWSKIVVRGNQLELFEGSSVSRYKRSAKIGDYGLDHYLQDNVDLLNDALKERGFATLEEILKTNFLRCDCNKWMGRQNVLSIKGAPQSWVIEMRNDSLHILRITNPDKDPDDPFQTEKIVSYNWRQR